MLPDELVYLGIDCHIKLVQLFSELIPVYTASRVLLQSLADLLLEGIL